MIGAGLAVIVAGAAVVLGSGVLGSNGPAHVLVTPDKLGAYVRRPQLEKQMNAAQLQRQVITKSAGQATHVVSAVYEDGTSATSTQPPQMILFIGGNLTGVSAAGFIASFTQQSKGAFVTSAGSLGGSAACVNAQASVPGSVALCTWADNDTFGVVASPTMSATRLATQLRAVPADGRARRQVGLAGLGGSGAGLAGGAADQLAASLPCCGRGLRSENRTIAMARAAASTASPTSSPPISRVLNGKVAAASVTRTLRALGSTAE